MLVKKNIEKFLSMYSKIHIKGLLLLIGLSAVCIFRNYVVVISIGTGIFSSALCMFVYEIINAVRYKKEVINDFKDIAQQVQTYYCCTNQCKKAVKTFPESEIVLRKNALAVESYNTILLGNMLINNIEKLKHNYQPCLSNNSLITLNDISEAIRDNMRFISNASSNVTTEFNDYWIISESVKNSLDRLQQIIRVERSIFYEM